MKKIRIISLGEIVTPNINKGVLKLATIVAEKISPGSSPPMPQVQAALQSNLNIIEHFKQGLLTEDKFDELFIAALYKATDVQLTVAEFNSAWAEMNPSYASFQSALASALDFNTKENQKLIFISYTNPKDLRHLRKELQNNNVRCEIDANDNLSGIGGVKLHSTYLNKMSKANLIEKVITELRSAESPRHGLFTQAQTEIKYIHSVRDDIQLQILREDFEKDSQSVQANAKNLGVDSILWNKQSVSLAQVLNEEAPVCHLAPSLL